MFAVHRLVHFQWNQRPPRHPWFHSRQLQCVPAEGYEKRNRFISIQNKLQMDVWLLSPPRFSFQVKQGVLAHNVNHCEIRLNKINKTEEQICTSWTLFLFLESDTYHSHWILSQGDSTLTSAKGRVGGKAVYEWKRLSKLDEPTSTMKQIARIYPNFSKKIKWNSPNALSINLKLKLLLLLLLKTFKLWFFFWKKHQYFNFFINILDLPQLMRDAHQFTHDPRNATRDTRPLDSLRWHRL